MNISKKLTEIYTYAKLSIENIRIKEEKLLVSNAEGLQTDAEAFKDCCEDYAKKFDCNAAELEKREIYKSRLAFVDETGRSPAELRERQTRCLKKLREYFVKEIEQSDIVSDLEDEYKRIKTGVRSMERSKNVLADTEAAVESGIAKTVKATKNFFVLLLLLSAAFVIFLLFFLNVTGIIRQQGAARILVSALIAFLIFSVLFLGSGVFSVILRRRNTEKLLLLTDSTEEPYINTYLEKYNDAAKQITNGLESALAAVTGKNTAYMEKLTDYYLTFLPDNIVYIINPVIDGLESGMSFGEAVWRSDDRLQANAKHTEIMDSFKHIGEHLYSLEDLQKDQISAQKKQLAALNAQTAAVAANTAATLAQNAEIGRQKDALSRMAEEIRTNNNT